MSEIDVSWNPLDKGPNVVLSGFNKISAGSGNVFSMVRADVGRDDGDRIFELEFVSADSAASIITGLADANASLAGYPGNTPNSAGIQWQHAPLVTQPFVNGMTRANGFSVSGTSVAGDRITVYHKRSAGGAVWFARNGLMASGDPVAGTNPSLTGVTGMIFPAVGTYNAANALRLHTQAANIVHGASGFISWAEGEAPPPPPPPPLPGFFKAHHFGVFGRVDVPQIAASVALPSSFVIAPGNYVFAGYGFNCSAPGLYRFWDGATPIIQTRAVLGGDLYAFLSAISWHHVHGLADEVTASVPPYTDNAYWQARFNSGTTSKWEMRCGFISTMMKWLLPQFGYPTDVINFVTTGPTNGVDDGHIVFQVFDGGKWKLWDITSGVYFTLNGVHLSAAEIIAAGVLNCQRVSMGAPDKFNSVTTTTQSPAVGFDIGSYLDMRHLTPADIDTWFFEKYQAWSVG